MKGKQNSSKGCICSRHRGWKHCENRGFQTTDVWLMICCAQCCSLIQATSFRLSQWMFYLYQQVLVFRAANAVLPQVQQFGTIRKYAQLLRLYIYVCVYTIGLYLQHIGWHTPCTILVWLGKLNEIDAVDIQITMFSHSKWITKTWRRTSKMWWKAWASLKDRIAQNT